MMTPGLIADGLTLLLAVGAFIGVLRTRARASNGNRRLMWGFFFLALSMVLDFTDEFTALQWTEVVGRLHPLHEPLEDATTILALLLIGSGIKAERRYR